MAAAASVKVLVNGSRKYSINVKGIFDTADETDTVIIDRSTLTGPSGTIPTYIRIDEITWNVGAGFQHIILSWDDGTDEVIDYFDSSGYMDFRPDGGKCMSAAPTTDTEGDLQLTGLGGAAGDTYSFLIRCSLKD